MRTKIELPADVIALAARIMDNYDGDPMTPGDELAHRICELAEGGARPDDSCPTCGCRPGDGRTQGCADPIGCGYAFA